MEIKTLTLQEAFDKVLAHSRAMTHQSADSNPDNNDPKYPPNCLYRAPDGNKCFAGVLIPDELYNPEFEGASIVALIDHYPEIRKLLIGENGGIVKGSPRGCFYNLIQSIHDNHFDGREIELANLAKVYNLEYSSPEAV